jgi:outer membrane protein OmpA-like peptidoglycan-associated protein
MQVAVMNRANRRVPKEMPLSGSQIKNMLRKSRYLLLAGTMLSTLAIPQWSAASDRLGQGTIILAQGQPGGDPKDPRQKGQPKGKQAPQQKAQPPQGQPGPRQGGQPPQEGQPRQGQPPTQQRQGIPPQQPQQRQQVQPQPQPRQIQPQPQAPQQQQQVQPTDRQPKELRKGPQQKQPPSNVQQRQGVPPQQAQPQQQTQPQQQGQPQQGQPPQGQRPQGVQRVPADQVPQQAPGQQGRQPAPGQQPAQVAPGGPLPKGGQQAQPKSLQQRQPGMANIDNVDQLRSQRRERREAGGRTVIEEPGRRFIVRENGRTFIRHDDSERFRGLGNARVERRGSESITTIRRPGGVEIISVTDANGRLLRRIRRGPDRREVVLIDNRPRGRAGFFLDLPPPAVSIPRERYIVDVSEAPPERLYEALEAPPVEPIERAYSLDEIRYNVALRDRMPRVDIDTINFETGSWEVAPDQVSTLQAIADAIVRVVSRNPDEVFMIEGHTDAVGSDDDNLSLSDRRAASVADILTNNFQVPPENLITQGYGEQNLKVQTDGPSRENRRVTVRRITPLLQGASR